MFYWKGTRPGRTNPAYVLWEIGNAVKMLENWEAAQKKPLEVYI
jgi:hypothetical protein